MFEDVRIEGDGDFVRIVGTGYSHAIRRLKDCVDDIADQVEKTTREIVPVKTGALKAHPLDRSDASVRHFGGGLIRGRESGVVTDLPLFGGGTAIRGAGGRFVKGIAEEAPGTQVSARPTEVEESRAVIVIELSVPREPQHAIWVHEGTGVYGPHETPIVSPRGRKMIFEIDGRKFSKYSVRGQHSNPYLTKAFEIVDLEYVPQRVARLQAELEF